MKLRSCRMRRFSGLVAPSLVLLLASLTAGCATCPKTIRVDPCAGWAPIYPSKNDSLTDGTARQILAHDEHGAKVCHWVPRN